ncbi:hypothetical protein ACFLZV_07460 [Candidatus Margulisiibacteriota bacterium]
MILIPKIVSVRDSNQDQLKEIFGVCVGRDLPRYICVCNKVKLQDERLYGLLKLYLNAEETAKRDEVVLTRSAMRIEADKVYNSVNFNSWKSMLFTTIEEMVKSLEDELKKIVVNGPTKKTSLSQAMKIVEKHLKLVITTPIGNGFMDLVDVFCDEKVKQELSSVTEPQSYQKNKSVNGR